MPITKQEFEASTEPPPQEMMDRVLAFLKDNRDKAYTEDEISRALRTPDTGANFVSGSVSPALRRLFETGAVDAKRFDGTLYFAYREDLRV